MKKLMLGGLGTVAALGAAALAGGRIVVADEPASTAPPPEKKRKTKKRRQVAKANRLLNPYSKSKYIPGGEERNCGERGISPKLFERVLAATKRRKGVKNPKMKEK